ncbi:hypothetical protein J437_LFUL004480 [Ladona fulva]|uniref:Cuticle protein 19 n=1 Tax=Ladona fulva TaxID=123851 RepID=A0A8K0K0K7_LADFU|nr:hypothetical protein J437_LFUL004480 [Ladona fulva]
MVCREVSPKYNYGYTVQSPHTGDVKNQWEERDGDVVKGSYSVNDSDGTIRQVDYTADKYNGFNAVVKKLGKAVHPNTLSHYSGAYGQIHNSHIPSHRGTSYVSVNRGIDHHLFNSPTTFDGSSFERSNFGLATSYANGNLQSFPFRGSSDRSFLGDKTPYGNSYESAINHYGGPADSFSDEHAASYFGDFNGGEEHYRDEYFH